MTFLKDEGCVQPIQPGWSNKAADRYWAIELDLVMIVEGRSLRYEARWPRQTDNSKAYGSGQVSIAAAFKPGTA